MIPFYFLWKWNSSHWFGCRILCNLKNYNGLFLLLFFIEIFVCEAFLQCFSYNSWHSLSYCNRQRSVKYYLFIIFVISERFLLFELWIRISNSWFHFVHREKEILVTILGRVMIASFFHLFLLKFPYNDVWCFS